MNKWSASTIFSPFSSICTFQVTYNGFIFEISWISSSLKFEASKHAKFSCKFRWTSSLWMKYWNWRQRHSSKIFGLKLGLLKNAPLQNTSEKIYPTTTNYSLDRLTIFFNVSPKMDIFQEPFEIISRTYGEDWYKCLWSIIATVTLNSIILYISVNSNQTDGIVSNFSIKLQTSLHHLCSYLILDLSFSILTSWGRLCEVLGI